MKYYILHNIHDEFSRSFVANLPKDSNEYTVIDWYGDEGARFSYEGPPASAFPSVVIEDSNEFFMVRAPESWEEIDQALQSKSKKEKHPKLSFSNKDRYIGGQTVEELDSLVKTHPHYFKNRALVEAKINTVKDRKNGKEIKRMG